MWHLHGLAEKGAPLGHWAHWIHCPCLLEKPKSSQWSQQNAAHKKWAGLCWVLAPCFPTHAGFHTVLPASSWRRNKEGGKKKKRGKNLLRAKEPGESSSKWQLAPCLPPMTHGGPADRHDWWLRDLPQLWCKTPTDTHAHSPQQAPAADRGTIPKHGAF